jgi:hypothetical protein
MNIFTALLCSLHYDIFPALSNLTPLRFYSLNPSALLYVTLIFLSTLHFLSLHFYLLHFASLIITFLTLFLKLYVLPVRAPISPSVSWFQSVIVLFTKEYLLTSALCFLALIFQLWSTLLRYLGACNLSPIAFHALSPVKLGFDCAYV